MQLNKGKPAIEQLHQLVVKQITSHLDIYHSIITKSYQKYNTTHNNLYQHQHQPQSNTNFNPQESLQIQNQNHSQAIIETKLKTFPFSKNHQNYNQKKLKIYSYPVIHRLLYDVLQLETESIDFILRQIFNYPSKQSWRLQQIIRIIIDVQFVISVKNLVLNNLLDSNNAQMIKISEFSNSVQPQPTYNNKDTALFNTSRNSNFYRIKCSQLSELLFQCCFFLPKQKVSIELIEQIVQQIDQINGKKGFVLLVEYKNYIYSNMVNKHLVPRMSERFSSHSNNSRNVQSAGRIQEGATDNCSVESINDNNSTGNTVSTNTNTNNNIYTATTNTLSPSTTTSAYTKFSTGIASNSPFRSSIAAERYLGRMNLIQESIKQAQNQQSEIIVNMSQKAVKSNNSLSKSKSNQQLQSNSHIQIESNSNIQIESNSKNQLSSASNQQLLVGSNKQLQEQLQNSHNIQLKSNNQVIPMGGMIINTNSGLDRQLSLSENNSQNRIQDNIVNHNITMINPAMMSRNSYNSCNSRGNMIIETESIDIDQVAVEGDGSQKQSIPILNNGDNNNHLLNNNSHINQQHNTHSHINNFSNKNTTTTERGLFYSQKIHINSNNNNNQNNNNNNDTTSIDRNDNNINQTNNQVLMKSVSLQQENRSVIDLDKAGFNLNNFNITNSEQLAVNNNSPSPKQTHQIKQFSLLPGSQVVDYIQHSPSSHINDIQRLSKSVTSRQGQQYHQPSPTHYHNSQQQQYSYVIGDKQIEKQKQEQNSQKLSSSLSPKDDHQHNYNRYDSHLLGINMKEGRYAVKSDENLGAIVEQQQFVIKTPSTQTYAALLQSLSCALHSRVYTAVAECVLQLPQVQCIEDKITNNSITNTITNTDNYNSYNISTKISVQTAITTKLRQYLSKIISLSTSINGISSSVQYPNTTKPVTLNYNTNQIAHQSTSTYLGHIQHLKHIQVTSIVDRILNKLQPIISQFSLRLQSLSIITRSSHLQSPDIFNPIIIGLLRLLGEEGFKLYHSQKQYNHQQQINTNISNDTKTIINTNNKFKSHQFNRSFSLSPQELTHILKQSYLPVLLIVDDNKKQEFSLMIEKLVERVFTQNGYQRNDPNVNKGILLQDQKGNFHNHNKGYQQYQILVNETEHEKQPQNHQQGQQNNSYLKRFTYIDYLKLIDSLSAPVTNSTKSTRMN